MVCTASDDADEDVETKTNTMTTMDAKNNYYNRNHADDELIMTMTMFFFRIGKQPAALAILPNYMLVSLIFAVAMWLANLSTLFHQHPFVSTECRAVPLVQWGFG